MTVAAFLLECEGCHDKIGLMTGAVESFICWSCAAEKMFGSGKDGSLSQGSSADVPQVPRSNPPVPANPGPVNVAGVSPPSPGPGPFLGPVLDPDGKQGKGRYWGGDCVDCGRQVWLAFPPSDDTQELSSHPKYRCAPCFTAEMAKRRRGR